MTVTNSANTKMPLVGDSVVSDGTQLVPARLMGRNRLYNSDMMIDQQVGPYTIVGTASSPQGQYTLDGWYVVSSGPSITVSNVPGSTPSSLWIKLSRNSGTGLVRLGQTIPINIARGAYAQILSAQLRAFCDSGFNLPVTLKVFTGTGSTDSNNCVSPFNGQATVLSQNFTPTTLKTLITAISQLTGPTVTQLSFELSWTYVSPVVASSEGLYFTSTQLETSSNPSAYERVRYDDQLAYCSFFYRKSYGLLIRPGTAASGAGINIAQSLNSESVSSSGLLSGNGTIQALSNGYFIASIGYEPMFQAPKVTIYSYNGVSAVVSDGSGQDCASASGSTTDINEKSYALYNGSGKSISPASGAFIWHHVLDARI